ncbi:alpha/beta hydrolase [Massilia sp. W12]|uniref:alpha/beta hydrolase n=1 Tax=Massilia sp. W12 TaxID=3126507 RepID=UPI0030CB5F54
MMMRLKPLATGLFALCSQLSAQAAIQEGLADANLLPRPTIPQIQWQTCPDMPDLQCAEVNVPLDYRKPQGEKITLALNKYPASNPAQKIGTLFVNPGGPGGSGVDAVANGLGAGLDRGLQGRFDVIGFDPRGVARSTTLRCFASEEERARFLQDMPWFPYQEAQYRPFFAKAQEVTQRCLNSANPVTAYMSTENVARDMDLLRQAVGDAKLSYIGFSYGSFLGATYAALFPKNLRALVIDGVLDPALWSSGWQIWSDRKNTEQSFNEFLRLCDGAGIDLCPLKTRQQSAAQRYHALLDAVRKKPLEFGGQVFDYPTLVGISAQSLYRPESWGGPNGFGAIFAMLADAALEQKLELLPQARQLLKDMQQGAAAPAGKEEYRNGYEAFFGNHCADADYPGTELEFRAIDFLASIGSVQAPYWWWSSASCAKWPSNKQRYTGPWQIRTNAPVLVVGNYFDGVTSYEGAQAAHRALQGSRLLSYAGWGHCAYGRNACVREYVNQYLLEGRLPPAGTVCAANPNPFLPQSGLMKEAVDHSTLPALPPNWPLR